MYGRDILRGHLRTATATVLVRHSHPNRVLKAAGLRQCDVDIVETGVVTEPPAQTIQAVLAPPPARRTGYDQPAARQEAQELGFVIHLPFRRTESASDVALRDQPFAPLRASLGFREIGECILDSTHDCRPRITMRDAVSVGDPLGIGDKHFDRLRSHPPTSLVPERNQNKQDDDERSRRPGLRLWTTCECDLLSRP